MVNKVLTIIGCVFIACPVALLALAFVRLGLGRFEGIESFSWTEIYLSFDTPGLPGGHLIEMPTWFVGLPLVGLPLFLIGLIGARPSGQGTANVE